MLLKNLNSRYLCKILLPSLILLVLLVANLNAQSPFQLEVSPKEDKLISRVLSNLKLFDTKSGNIILNINGFPDGKIQPQFASFASTGKEFFIIDKENKVTWWDTENGKLLAEYKIDDSNIYQTSPDKKLLALVHSSDNDDGEIRIYEIGERKFNLIRNIPSPFGIRNIEFSSNNKDLLAIGLDLDIISLKTGKTKKTFRDINSFRQYSISPQRNSILFADKFWRSEKPFLKFHLNTLKKNSFIIKKQYQDLLYEINSFGFSSTNPSLVFFAGNTIAPKSGKLVIYNVKSNKVEVNINNNLEITSAVIASDGKSIFFQDLSNRIFLADIKTGNIFQVFDENLKYLSPTGKI